MVDTKNVFISHVHKDDDGLTDLKNLLKTKGMEVRDGSINSEKPNNAESESYIKSEILAPRINWASVMIVYISPETKDSKWVNWEIEYAYKQGKTIIGVWERGAKDCEVPEALDQYGHALVGWNADKIIDAINGDYEKFEDPDGTPCPPRPIGRHPC
ncbi:TIR domain-containing protein [Thalassospira povalilytica]|uniref:TIR domain-containing protein n=1 Tax=Thalassospira povalilytica TaxID=732237 RepID=A0A8I1M7X2_9PROT|nr:TIR domain-containing protein [Thalassospira povalilytica]MBN8196862.1 TIR domain-containing protein [Thalassospira povalilytica]